MQPGPLTRSGSSGDVELDKFLGSSADPELDDFLAGPKPEGELGFGTRSGLSFLSGDDERLRYLGKKYPGSKIGSYKGKQTIQIPGEQAPKYIDDPRVSLTDIADFAGDIPGAIGGTAGGLVGGGVASIPAAAAGGAAGEVARKAIGRKYVLGEDVYQPEKLKEDVGDVAFSGLLTGGGQALGVGAKALAARKAGVSAGKEVAKDIAQTAGKEVAETGEAALTRKGVPFPPETVDDMVKLRQADIARGVIDEMPSAQRLEEIVTRNPDLKHKPTAIHRQMLKSKQDYDLVDVKYRQMPSEQRLAMESYDQKMKKEIVDKIDDLAGDAGKTKSEVGKKAMQDVGALHEAEQKALSPVFDQMHDVSIPIHQHIPMLVDAIAQKAPRFAGMLEVDQNTGKLLLQPFSSKYGISKPAYGAMREVVKDLNSGELNFKAMQNMREFLRTEINPMNPGATRDLQAIRQGMLDHMENLIESVEPNLKVRETFKKWAINEKNLENFESVIGGKIDDIEKLFKANPEKVMDNIFSNENNIDVVRSILGQERFSELSKDFLASLRNRAFDTAKNDLSLPKLSSLLKQKRAAIEAAMGPDTYRRLVDLTDLGKIIPDRPSSNPSGTAKSFFEMAQRWVKAPIKETASAFTDKMAEKDAVKFFDSLMQARKEPSRSEFARKLLPYIDNPKTRAIIQNIANTGGRSVLMGPSEDGLIEEQRRSQGRLKGPNQ